MLRNTDRQKSFKEETLNKVKYNHKVNTPDLPMSALQEQWGQKCSTFKWRQN